MSKKNKKSSPSRNWQGSWPKTLPRLFGIAIVLLYQLSLSGFIGNTCRHLPTCSEYAYEAIARHGLWLGGWLAFFRIIKCGPFGSSGYDPVPKKLSTRYRWWRPWQK